MCTKNASRLPLGHRVAGSHQQTKPKKAQTARVSMMMHVLFSPPEKHFLRGFPYFDTRNIRYTGNSILNTKLLLRVHKVPVLSPTISNTVLISYFISSPSYKKLGAAVAWKLKISLHNGWCPFCASVYYYRLNQTLATPEKMLPPSCNMHSTQHSHHIYMWLVDQVSRFAVHSTPSGVWPPKKVSSTHRSSRLLARMTLARLYLKEPSVDVSIAATTAVIEVVVWLLTLCSLYSDGRNKKDQVPGIHTYHASTTMFTACV